MVLATLIACGADATNTDNTTSSVVSVPITPSTEDASVGELPVDPCAGLELGGAVPVTSDPVLTEISGAVLASDHGDGPSLWVHQDSGHPAVITRLGLDGIELQSVALLDIEPFDWEDIAAAIDAEGQRHLFVGDIGDNRRARRSIEVVRFPEPRPHTESVESGQVLELVLPDGPVDAEALIVDPHTDDLIVISKEISGVADVLVAPGGAWAQPGDAMAMVHVGRLTLGLGNAVLAADIDPVGMVVGVRTPTQVLLWTLAPGRSVSDVLVGSEPCSGPAPFDIFGEALALDEHGYVLIGESAEPTLRIVSRP